MVLTYHCECCSDLTEFCNSGYVDGEQVYLQGADKPTNLRANLRRYQFCVTCGCRNAGHPDDVAGCTTLGYGLNNNQFRQTGNEFTFNPITKQEEEQSQPKVDFLVLRHCPYCGRKYEQPTLS